MTTSIFFEDSFDSAHSLPLVPETHKCRRVHGHTYRIRIEISGPVGPLGWIVDYAEIKERWSDLKRHLDHRNLNDLLPNPTCELLADYIYEALATRLSGLSRIELRETEHCGAEVRSDAN
jgi:6-pyruvoyltetrahydropterin/6-carboxytetrahydropterin synthase